MVCWTCVEMSGNGALTVTSSGTVIEPWLPERKRRVSPSAAGRLTTLRIGPAYSTAAIGVRTAVIARLVFV